MRPYERHEGALGSETEPLQLLGAACIWVRQAVHELGEHGAIPCQTTARPETERMRAASPCRTA